jgi:hypothetical protein
MAWRWRCDDRLPQRVLQGAAVEGGIDTGLRDRAGKVSGKGHSR